MNKHTILYREDNHPWFIGVKKSRGYYRRRKTPISPHTEERK